MDIQVKPPLPPQSGLTDNTGAPFNKWTQRNAVFATLIVLAVAAAFVLAWRFQGVLFSFWLPSCCISL